MRVVVAMSGGVDSSVAAYELKKKGYDVIGMTMKTWSKEECDAEPGQKVCCSLEAVQMAKSVADDLGISHHVIDLSKEFTEEIESYFAEEYSKGRTPNPCIYCNSRMKFGYLFNKARELNADKIATGHFARIVEKDGRCCLAVGKDEKKDQSYFLYAIQRELLSSILFPLGEYTKAEVREIAGGQGFMTADRPSSQDICFGTADGDYRTYLEKMDTNSFSPGDIVDNSGKVVGGHKGIESYTVGQRQGLGIAMGEPVYVTEIDPEKNIIVVGPRGDAMKSRIRVTGFNWLSISGLDKEMSFDTKLRSVGVRAKSKVVPSADDEAIVKFEEPQFAPTPGQAAVFYDGDIVAGGAWIEEVLE